jgi:hypothetical protein
MENGENFFSSTGEEWRMKKVLLFFTWGCFFHLESTLQKCMMDDTTDFKSEFVNRT